MRPNPGVRCRNLKTVTAVPSSLDPRLGAAARGVGAGARQEFTICIALLESRLGERSWAATIPVGDWSCLGFGLSYGNSEDCDAKGDEGEECGNLEVHIGGLIGV